MFYSPQSLFLFQLKVSTGNGFLNPGIPLRTAGPRAKATKGNFDDDLEVWLRGESRSGKGLQLEWIVQLFNRIHLHNDIF